MISSKKIDLIVILLIALVFVFVVYAMLLPQSALTGYSSGTFSYDGAYAVTITEDDYYTTYAQSSVAKINLKGSTITSGSKNVIIDGSNATILGGGTYVLSGTLDDGSIIIDAADDTEVRLVLNGVSITSTDFSAIYIKQASKTVISLVPGTENILTDASTYNEEKQEEGKPNAALYSRDDLVINGTGSLTVNGNYQDGIKSNDTLKITEGTISVNALDDGINANDYIAVLEVTLTVISGGDAIKCEHEESDKGFITFEGTKLVLISQGDGISASSALFMNGTDTQITSGGGSQNAKSGEMSGMGRRGDFSGSQISIDTTSTKAIKAGTEFVINGGSFTLDSADDSLHSDGNLTIENGVFLISAGDDAVHAERNLVLNPESMDITKCYEGLEGAYITINGGDIRIVSSDDGINASGEGSSGGMGGRMMNMQGLRSNEEKTAEEDIWLTINGGHIYVETSGDGLDSNGSAVLNNGFLEIYGPENSGNGSIDVGDGGYVFIVNGGSLLAVGSSGMAEHPTEYSSQQSLTFYLEETHLAGSSISVIDSSGNAIISGTSNKKFDWICVSAEKIIENETYTLVINGNEMMEITANGSVASSGSRSNTQTGMGGTGVTRGGVGGQDNPGRRK